MFLAWSLLLFSISRIDFASGTFALPNFEWADGERESNKWLREPSAAWSPLLPALSLPASRPADSSDSSKSNNNDDDLLEY